MNTSCNQTNVTPVTPVQSNTFVEASMPPGEKYRPYPAAFRATLPDRTWPDREITQAPIWCSVDLRDGNQALVNPMDIPKKMAMFLNLRRIGFKEIEIGFPSASQTEFDFTRALINKKMIPHGVVPQVLVQAREHLIRRTFESLEGVDEAIVHIYNSTSETQRRVVFNKPQNEIIDIAVAGVELIKKLSKETGTKIRLEYSPESFTGTEMPFAKAICEAVMDAWQPTRENRIIFNLPATVEMSTPNHYADQIEWFCRNIKNRDCVIVSVHPHNDRGTAVAAAELAMKAGADRVEGTLFGNGERTGNVDLVTVALNMFTQGIDPRLDLSNIPRIRRIAEVCTEMEVHPRQPYAGDLVFTAFSGSHQDAINKGMRRQGKSAQKLWDVPYLPIDPRDVGRSYEKIVRLNSQSGKGGAAYVLNEQFSCDMPKDMHPEFGAVIQTVTDRVGREISPKEVWQEFEAEYLNRHTPFQLVDFKYPANGAGAAQQQGILTLMIGGQPRSFTGAGQGPIEACCNALVEAGAPAFQVKSFHEHSRSSGKEAEAVAYIEIETEGGEKKFGAGIHKNSQRAAVMAVISAVNRAAESQRREQTPAAQVQNA